MTRALRVLSPPHALHSLARTTLWAHGSGTKCVVFQLWLMHFVLCDRKCLIACQGWLRLVECGAFFPFLWFPEGGRSWETWRCRQQGKCLHVVEFGFSWETPGHTGNEHIKSWRMDRGKKEGGGVWERERKKEGGGDRGALFPVFFWSNDSWFCPDSHDKVLWSS